MSPWPPSVLISAAEDLTRMTLRDMLRRSGVNDVELHGTWTATIKDLKAHKRRWHILIIESPPEEALGAVQEVHRDVGEHVKVMLVLSGPTKEQIVEAIQSGVSDFLTYPFSQATLEEKLRKISGPSGKSGPGR